MKAKIITVFIHVFKNGNTENKITKFTLARLVVQLITWGLPCHYCWKPSNAVLTLPA
jgi:hypothetical protein